MAPDYCPDHGELMRSLGAVEANQEQLCTDVAEIKNLLKEKAREDKAEELARTEMNTKTKVLLAAIGTFLVAAISSGTHYLILKICG